MENEELGNRHGHGYEAVVYWYALHIKAFVFFQQAHAQMHQAPDSQYFAPVSKCVSGKALELVPAHSDTCSLSYIPKYFSKLLIGQYIIHIYMHICASALTTR